MQYHRLKPGRRYYVIAILVLFAGGAAFVSHLYRGLNTLTEDLVSVVAPGAQFVTLPEAGDYTIFYEYQSVIGDRSYSTAPVLSGLLCELSSQETDDAVQLYPSSDHSEYSSVKRAGIAIFDFWIDQPGIYRFTAVYEEGQEGQEIVLSFGHEFKRKLRKLTFTAVAILVSSTTLAIVMATMVFLKRRRAKEERQKKRRQA